MPLNNFFIHLKTCARIKLNPIINPNEPRKARNKNGKLKNAAFLTIPSFHQSCNSYPNTLSEPFRIGIQSANPIIMKTTPNTNEYLSMKATILFGFMFFFLLSSLMKYNITKKVTAIAPKVIALFIQRFSGFTIYSPLRCKPMSQPTAISVTPTDNPIIKFRKIEDAISSVS